MPLPPPPLVAPVLDVINETATLWVADEPEPVDGGGPDSPLGPGTQPQLHTLYSNDGTVLTHSLEGRGTGPVYVGFPGGTVVRVQWDTDALGWTLDIVLRGSNVTAWTTYLDHPDAPFSGRAELQGERLRPPSIEFESPAAPHLYQHRTMPLRTARAARWWPTLSSEVQTLLTDGWTILGDQLVHLDYGDIDLANGWYIVIEDLGPPQVMSQLQLARQWQQTTGPTVHPATPPPIEGDPTS